MKIVRSKVNPRKIDAPNKSWDILFYDEMNDYPQRIANIVNASGITVQCRNLYAKFIEGDGFSDKSFYKLIVNEDGLTGDKLLRKIAFDLADISGIAIHINYNALYKIASLKPVPFSECRLPDPDGKHQNKIAIHPNWLDRNKVDEKSICWIDRFNPDPAVIQQQVNDAGGWDKYKGQIFWFSKDGNHKYPLAMYDSVLEDIETDARIKSRRRKKAATDYGPDYWIIQYGKFESEHEEQEAIENLELDQGDEASSLKLIQVDLGDQKPEILPVPQAASKTNYSIENEKQAQDNIRKSFGIPGVLIGEAQAGALGLSTQMLDSYAIMNAKTNQERRIIEEIMTRLISNFVNNKITDFSIIPSQYNTGNDKAPLAVQFGVGGTQAVQNILIDQAIAEAQKINTLIILFGLTKVQAESMVKGTPIPEEVTPE